MVDQEIRVLGDENIIANPKNSQKQYPLTFKAVSNVIVYGRKKADLNFAVPITEGTNFNFNLERTAIIFSDSFNLEEYSYIMVKNPFEEISDFFYVSSLEELDPTGKEFNEFNDEVVKWLRRLVNIISNRCMIFETTLFKDLNNFPNIKSGQTFLRTKDGWTGITLRDINSELNLIFNKYIEEINKKIQEHQTQMNKLLEQWKQDIQKYAENVKQYDIVRVVTQTGHGFVFEPVMYSISQRKFVKAVFPHGADGVAVRVDDNNFRLVWAGRVGIPSTAKDTQQRDFVLGEYYFLGEGSNGGIQREKPDTYYQHLFQVMHSDELRQNIADVLLSVPINQKGKRWNIGEAKTTVNDIEELKISDFPVGKVVEVLGYYKAGDGADHKRIISATNDGSGVQLNNGLWANIVHNGEVNVSWFGAKGDGVTDDTEAINKSFSFRGKTSVFFPSGTFLCNSTIKAKDVAGVKGNGAGYTTIKANMRMETLYKQSPKMAYTYIKDITFDGNDLVDYCLDTTFEDNLPPSLANDFENVHIRGGKWKANRNNDVSFRNCVIHGNSYGLECLSSGGMIRFTDCLFYSPVTLSCQNGSFYNCVLSTIKIQSGDDNQLLFSGCYFYQNINYNSNIYYDNSRSDYLVMNNTRFETSKSDSFLIGGTGTINSGINFNGCNIFTTDEATNYKIVGNGISKIGGNEININLINCVSGVGTILEGNENITLNKINVVESGFRKDFIRFGNEEGNSVVMNGNKLLFYNKGWGVMCGKEFEIVTINSKETKSIDIPSSNCIVSLISTAGGIDTKIISVSLSHHNKGQIKVLSEDVLEVENKIATELDGINNKLKITNNYDNTQIIKLSFSY